MARPLEVFVDERLPRSQLADALRRLIEANVPLEGASDHGVSDAIYLRDPDDNGVKLYCDRPMDAWPRTAAGALATVTEPLDLPALPRETQPVGRYAQAIPVEAI